MVDDPEKADGVASHEVPHDLDDSVLHPGVATTKGEESGKKEDDEGSVHSQSSRDSIGPVPEVPAVPPTSNSKPASVRSRTLSIVPRSERRGLLGRFAIIPEVGRPYDYRNGTKWLITLIVALAATAAPLGSAIFFRECFTYDSSGSTA
jgi:hypothetical protein